MDRRRFLQSIAIASVAPTFSLADPASDSPVGPLRPDPGELLDLPEGFQYRIVSKVGDPMSDGLRVPAAHDGMAAFPGDDGRIILVCNHELEPSDSAVSAFRDQFDQLPDNIRNKFYDRGSDLTPAAGGTTTAIYDPASGATERIFLSLAGTEWNCAGGPTPWHSWLSCEETFRNPASGPQGDIIVTRDVSHGYVFEVPSRATSLVNPRPIREMGKFVHEAAAVHEASGVIYLTEDRRDSLFYRFIPNVPGELLEGGRLQALVIDDQPSINTHNWSTSPDVQRGVSMPTHWIDLDDVDSVNDDLRQRGAEIGAAKFARGEGMCAAGEDFVFACSVGGADRLGQIFSYRASPFEATPGELTNPGSLTLLAESTPDSLLWRADNLILAPWGELLVCEDNGTHSGLIGIRADGSQYVLADNAYSNSELAGVCFSPDGKTLFINIQYPGMTLAITGPFPD